MLRVIVERDRAAITATFASLSGYIRLMRVFLASMAAAGVLFAVGAASASATSAAAQRNLRSALRGGLSAAGGASGAQVVDLDTGRTLFAASARVGRLPASVEKLYTTSTALLRFGPAATLSTQVLGVGSLDRSGGWHGTLYLKGGGDPTFGAGFFDRMAYGTGATIQRLVTGLVNQSGITSVHGSIVGDESYFDSLRGTPATGFAPSTEVEGELSGLAYDRGFSSLSGSVLQNRPALVAAQQFELALRAAGVKVPSATSVLTGATPAAAQPLAAVASPPMATLIALANTPSDNFVAEMLLKGIGARFGARGSTAAGAAVVRAQLARSFGIHPRVNDGSGLSRFDRTSPRDVIAALQRLASNRDFVNSLSIAGVTGTLAAGLRGTPAQGRCRGKTGTLHDVANQVGYCTARDGHTLAFAFLMNSVDPTAGHAIEDQMTVAVAKYAG
jgi:D-alanyl-D-alanine carboxypeptidase/D-alanyl-D-alanine-endopeptidase (penicillin-binding protein 4)